MPTYVALLRGINVGGARKIPMKELRAMCEALGYDRPRTYIASGNLVFDSGTGRRHAVEQEARLKEAIGQTFGHDDVPVMVRSSAELRAIHEANPYATADADPKRVHVAFLAKKPSAKGVKALEAFDRGPNELTITPRAVYVRYGEPMGRSKLTHGVFERRLGVHVTVRSLRTVQTLVDMAST